ncbi:hypothetical protein SAY87_030357 [Trapa incisa]|uniref:Uncharacterized protein n=1 Tax=Trapa incisa TaxID=236973 RepID=A0AAN7KU18_9MYRT|nr:hypothetical protein SAY87_030357 [Trapa incisa]
MECKSNHASAGSSRLLVVVVAILLMFSTPQGRILPSTTRPDLHEAQRPMVGAHRSLQLMKDLGFDMKNLYGTDNDRRSLASEERLAPGGPDPHHHLYPRLIGVEEDLRKNGINGSRKLHNKNHVHHLLLLDKWISVH